MRRQRDYAKKRFVRPRRAVRRRGRYVWAVIFASVMLLAAVNLPVLVAHLPIQKISVSGARLVSADRIAAFIAAQVHERRWLVLPQRMAVFFSTRQAEAKLRQLFPFASWSVQRSWLGGIQVTAAEREPQLVWVTASGAWYLDREGAALTTVPEVPGSPGKSGPSLAVIRPQPLQRPLPVVVDERGDSAPLKNPVVSSRVVIFIREIAASLEQGGSVGWSKTVTGFRYHPETAKLTVETAEGLEVYFAADQPRPEQLGKLKAVIAQGVLNRPGLRYIDVRFGQKVFYQ